MHTLLGAFEASVYNESPGWNWHGWLGEKEVTDDSKGLVPEQTQLLFSAFAKYPDFS